LQFGVFGPPRRPEGRGKVHVGAATAAHSCGL
jgi:hypothetical protein